jgi:hypothetical protein
MSRVPDEPQSWITEGDGEEVLSNLRQQIENARQRLGEQWNRAADPSGSDSGSAET